MEELEDMEEDAGLGNGGLGRLAGEHLLTHHIWWWRRVQSLLTDINKCIIFVWEPARALLMCRESFSSLFPGLHGLPGPGCVRLRYSLRIRHLQSENRQRLAGQEWTTAILHALNHPLNEFPIIIITIGSRCHFSMSGYAQEPLSWWMPLHPLV